MLIKIGLQVKLNVSICPIITFMRTMKLIKLKTEFKIVIDHLPLKKYLFRQ